MRKIARTIALTLAALAAANAVATDDFRVVVPLYGKKAVNSGIELKVAELPSGAVGQDYGPVDFTQFLVITSDKPYARADVTWSALSPLPAGLTLTPDGYLKGAPTAAAVDSAPFTVSATYAGKSAAQVYQVTVTPDVIDGPEDPPTPPETGGQQTISDGDAILTVAPTKLSFGLVARQLPTPPLVVGISNTGTKAAALTLGQPTLPEFKVTHNCPQSLPPGAACEASVVFTPKTISLVNSTFNVGLGQQAVAVSLSGTGRNSDALFTQLPKKMSYQDFGIVAAGQMLARQTVIKNISKYYALGIFKAEPAPGLANSAQFAIDNDECPPVLAVGESCTITDRYVPTVEGYHSTYGRVTMNVSGDRRDFYMTGHAAGALKITNQSHDKAYLPGGQQLTLYGNGFLPDSKVFFGETEAVVRYGNVNYLYATVPAVAEPETTYVRVVNADESEASAPKPFKRARSFGQLSVSGPLQFGKQALNMASQWQYYYVRNYAAYSTDTLEINDIQVTGPYQLDTSSAYCKVGQRVGASGGSCTVRVRFLPTEAGDMPGSVTVIANGEPLTMNLSGIGLAWEGTPSGSPSANTDLPYGTVLPGNEPVGGALQTKYVDVYFRNTNPNAQLNAIFELADGSAFKFYTVYATSNTGGSNANLGCLANSTAKQTSVCRADIGSGARPHIWVRLQATSAAGLGTHYEELVVKNAAGEEQFRIPLWLDVVYDVTAELYADRLLTTPIGEISAAKVQLAQEAYKDLWVANVGTQGMLRTDTVSLVDSNSPDIYFKADSLYRAATSTANIGTCGKLVSATEYSGCLSDDISGTAPYQHQRVRVYYKPMSAGLRTATLRIVHRGQGNNPLELPVTISPVEFNAVFSANPATGELAEVPTFRVPYNLATDNSVNAKVLTFYLNTTDGQPLKGSFILSGAGTEFTRTQFYPGYTNAGATGTGNCGMKNRLETALCGGQVNYPNFAVRLNVSSEIGEGTYNWKVTYYDPSLQELASVPVTVQVVNDAQFEVSASHNVSNPLPNDTLDLGTTSAPVVPGQVMTAINKVVYLRNIGTIGKIKFQSAAIEGGDGAFSLTQPIYINSSTSTANSYASCGSTRATDGYSASACTGYDPSVNPGVYDVGRFAVSYKATAAGRQNAVLKVWHNSKVGPNPIEIPLTAMAEGAQIAGEPSSAANSTIAPSGTYTPIYGAGYRDLSFWVRNTEAYGALYAPEISVEGDAFTLVYMPYRATDTGGYGSCGSTLSADKHWASACLADNADGTGLFRHMKFTVRCTTTTAMPKGTVNTGVLRVKTLGAEHLIPLSCTRS